MIRLRRTAQLGAYTFDESGNVTQEGEGVGPDLFERMRWEQVLSDLRSRPEGIGEYEEPPEPGVWDFVEVQPAKRPVLGEWGGLLLGAAILGAVMFFLMPRESKRGC